MPQKKQLVPWLHFIHQPSEADLFRIINGEYFKLHDKRGYRAALSWQDVSPRLLGRTRAGKPVYQSSFIVSDLDKVFLHASLRAKTYVELQELINSFVRNYERWCVCSEWYKSALLQSEQIRRMAGQEKFELAPTTRARKPKERAKAKTYQNERARTDLSGGMDTQTHPARSNKKPGPKGPRGETQKRRAVISSLAKLGITNRAACKQLTDWKIPLPKGNLREIYRHDWVEWFNRDQSAFRRQWSADLSRAERSDSNLPNSSAESTKTIS